LAVAAFAAIGCTALAAASVAAETACPPVTMAPLTLPATTAAVAEGRSVTIVALGSSSTAGVGASAPDKSYPAQLQAELRAAWPDSHVSVLNRGIGGQEVDTMLARLEHDVLAEHPVLVIWQAGSNAALRHMEPSVFQADLIEGLDKLAAIGADVIVMDSQIAPRIEAEPNNAAYGTILGQEAASHHDSLFSRTSLMKQWRDAGAEGMIGPDGLHQSDHGYACLAAALGRSIVNAVAPAVTSAGPHAHPR
jgi:acyl-CoA thioesterase I